MFPNFLVPTDGDQTKPPGEQLPSFSLCPSSDSDPWMSLVASEPGASELECVTRELGACWGCSSITPGPALGQCSGYFYQRVLEWGRFQVFCSILSAADFPCISALVLFLAWMVPSGGNPKAGADPSADGSEVQHAWLATWAVWALHPRGSLSSWMYSVSEAVHNCQTLLPDKRNHWCKKRLLTDCLSPWKHICACFSS